MTAAQHERTVRLRLPADGRAPREVYQPELAGALDRYHAAIMREPVLDPMEHELVRIRCAHVHTCRLCSHVRMKSAREAGADEDLLSQVDHYETSALLTERQKVILRLVDAHIFGHVPPGLAAQIAAHLSPDEAVAVPLLASKYSFQKTGVSLGLDAAKDFDLIDYDPETGVLLELK